MDERSREVGSKRVSAHDEEAGHLTEKVDGAGSNSGTSGSSSGSSSGGEAMAAGSLTGATIGHYLIEERLGGGAMAAVYRAHDQLLDLHVAIKVLLPGADSVMQARFRREARMVSTLAHPHIVRTLQVGRSGGIIYIAMELVEGISLADLLEQQGKLPVGDAVRVLAPVAEALAYAHERGIIHRDVKPSNILLQRARAGVPNHVELATLPYPVVPLLSDFGIARVLDAPELTNAGRTIGTPAFMAPEQCAGSSEIDGRADVYALGAVLYRCLVGRPPFSGTTTQILHAHVYDPLLIPDSVVNTLPPQIVQVMARAMMKDPSQRYERVDLMAVELQGVAALPLPSTPTPPADLIDPTMTMASLPVAQNPATSTSRVLVAAPAPTTSAASAASAASAVPATTASATSPGAQNTTPARVSPLKPIPRAPASGTPQPPRTIPLAPPAPTPRKQSRRNSWGMMALVGAFAVLVVLLVSMLLNSVWGGDENAVLGTTPTATLIAEGEISDGVAVVPSVSAEDVTPDASGGTPGAASSPTPEPSPTGPTPTPEPPIVDLESTWNEALLLYADQEWDLAIDALNLSKRGIEAKMTFAEEISLPLLNEMLVTSYMGLASQLVVTGRLTTTVDLLEKAVEIAPNTLLDAMVDDLAQLIELQGDDRAGVDELRKSLYSDLSLRFATYAAQLEVAGKVCDAAAIVNTAIRLADSEALRTRLGNLQASCAVENAQASIVELGGNILYSSSPSNGAYAIYRMPITSSTLATQGSSSSLVLANAAQPSLSPDGRTLAYHNRDQGGLWGISLGNGYTPFNNPVRFGQGAEDGRDAPASWNAYSTQVTYSARFSNGSSENIFIASANGDGQMLTQGKDPAWSPGRSLLVFNGYDENGQVPGLFTVAADGSNRTRLTSNGNDIRPAWTSDGRYLVFMSKDHPGEEAADWEIYRMAWPSGIVTRITDGSPAKDGLPAISPDGKWVAFMSDRGGRWKLWYVSIDGGDVQLLSDIEGQPLAWLEHSVQWVP